MSAYNWFMLILVLVVSIFASFIFLKDTFKTAVKNGKTGDE